jgi:outer membrane receptor protein involved in Fe transport
MKKLIQLLFLLLIVSFSSAFAQTGKITGKITDFETGEPLIGANILISGTSLGAASDANGEYVILNIPPNTYSIVAKYIGYQDVTNNNIRVSGNLTTEVNFALPSALYQTDEVVITSEKPLINKNITNTVGIFTAEDIQNLPVRGVSAVVSTQAGVVNQDGNLYVRGSRADQVAFYVDGVLVNDPLFGGATTLGIQNAIQEIQFQAGGYPAEYGGANAGIITTTTKIGGENFRLSMEAITDNLGLIDVGEKFLGNTYSYGFNEYVLTASGPLLARNIRFFVAGNNIFQRTPAGFHRGLNFQGVFDPAASAVSRDTFDVYYPEGYRLNQARNQYQVQGNISMDFNAFKVKVSGSYLFGEARNGTGYLNTRNANRAGLHEDQNITGSLKLTHVLGNKAFYDVIFNYFNDYSVDMDPLLKHNIVAYGDSVANAQVGTTLRSDGQFQRALNAYGFNFRRSTVPYNLYQKFRYENMGGQINLLYQAGQHHEIKTGADVKRYTIRRYSMAPVSIFSAMRAQPDGSPYDFYNRLDNYGYDVYGNEFNETNQLESPKNPIFAAFYIQDKMEFSDLVINAGLRLDYIDIDGKEFLNPGNIRFDQNDQIDPNFLVDSEPITQISPRLGFSFPVTDRTVFHAQYGKFIQQSRLRDVYQGYNLVADNIKGGFAIEAPVGFGLRPERTTQYEIGFKQQLGDGFAFDITGFYKDIKDQIQIRSVFAESGATHRQYYAFVNNDFSTVKGVELKFDLRRTQRIAATFDYTFSDAQGTGSNPSSSFRQIWQSPTATPFFPQQVAPLDFNQAHTGFLNVDYRFANDDGPSIFGSQFLSNTGANILFSVKSGYNYTRWDHESFGNRRFPIEALNTSTTPWTYQVDFRLDKSFNFGPLQTNVYLWVINVLNTQNVMRVFNTSGDAFDDNYLASREGSTIVQNYRNTYGDETAELYRGLYNAMNYNYTNFGPPRQIRLGIRLNY